ncbi:hypothetical protein AVEN_103640-1 [Araneus ventricosus]|uniref:Uncharacterized protein n=1 Tax=Araneus ventricosus TaxID=182803 RepID=A0A4Y2HBK7_ARAVE|nr:hypothetical protein AVEN_103640-1 [Araneus ventricosus]
MIGEDLQKFSESRVMRTIAIGANTNGMNQLPGISRLSGGSNPGAFGVAGAVMSGLPSLASAANPSLCLPGASPTSLSRASSSEAAPQFSCDEPPPRVRFSSAADLLQPPPCSSKPPSRRSSALSPAIHVTTPVDGVLTSL